MQARPRLLRACRSILPPNSRALHNSNKVDHIGGRKGCSAERWLVFGPGLRKCRQAVSAASEQQMPLEKRPAEDPSIEANDPGLETDSNPIRGNPNNLLQRIAFSLTVLKDLVRSYFGYFLQQRMFRLFLFLLLGLTMSFLGRMRLGSGGTKIGMRPQEVLYSEFLTLVESDNVKDVRFEEGSGRILFDLIPHSSVVVMTNSDDKLHDRSQTEASSDTARVSLRGRSSILKQFYTRHLPDQQLISLLRTHGVEFGTIRASVTSSIVRVVVTALALWIPLIPMFIIMRRFLEGRSGNGRRRKNSNSKSNVPTTRFRDVAGVGAAKRELMEVVDCLQDGSTYSKLGAKLPSGVLLSGPPGTGKTLLARAVAGEAGVPFISVSASEFVEMFVGRGAARVRELFSEARRLAPCVIFIDELDAVGSRRGMGMNEERDQTLNQLLTELDGFEGRPGVLLLAATNRPDVLDPALLRPGRLSRRIVVNLPDEQGRAEIASVHLRGVPLEGNGNSQDPVEPSVLINRASNVIAKLSFGFSGAEIANVVNEAAFLAARRKSETVSLADLADAVSRTRFGVGGGAESANWAAPLRRWVLEQLQPNDQSTRAVPMQ